MATHSQRVQRPNRCISTEGRTGIGDVGIHNDILFAIVIGKLPHCYRFNRYHCTMNILFLCTGNSCRSQMAEGWARELFRDTAHVYSAGIEAHGLNPHAVEVMAEAGVDISGQHSQSIEELPNVAWDLVVTVCDSARERCPFMPGALKTIHRSFPDPPQLAQGLPYERMMEVYRSVRDEIRDYVQHLKNQLEAESTADEHH
jgi:arsenate reductase